MRLPRDGGEELAKLLWASTGTKSPGKRAAICGSLEEGDEHRVTIPRHKPLRVGTLSSILRDVSEHLEVDRDALIRELFG